MEFEFTSDIRSIFEKDLVLTVMKRGAQPLINMIQNDNNLYNTIKLAFSDPEQLGKYKPLLKGCLHYILQGPDQIRSYIASSYEFITFINEFISEIQSKTMKQLVALNHILGSFLKLQDVELLTKINNPFPFLLQMVSNSCIGELVAHILLSCETVPSKFIDTFIEFFPKNDYAIYWFRSALHEKKTIISIDDAPKIADTLLSIAATKEYSIFKIQCYEICYMLKQHSMSNQLFDVFEKFKDNYDQTNCYAIKIFKAMSIDLLLKAFQLPENSFYNNAILGNFRQLPKAEQVKMAEEYDLPDKIISLYQQYDRSSVVFDIGLCLKALGSASPNLSSPAWTYLSRSVLAIKHLTSMNAYGGPLPSPVSIVGASPMVQPPSAQASPSETYNVIHPVNLQPGSPIFVASAPPSILFQ